MTDLSVWLSLHFARTKRLAPDWIVSLVDSLSSGGNSGKRKLPYHCQSSATDNPFFIVGCGRSGNTLLRTQLMARYDVCIPPEIPGMGNTIRSFTRSRGLEWESAVERTLKAFRTNADVDRIFPGSDKKYNLNDELAIDYDALTRRLAALDDADKSLSAIITGLYRSYLDNKEMTGARIGDKTPWNVFHLDRIAKVFPDAAYVNLIRDPRAVVASYLNNFNGVRNLSVAEAAYRWKDAVNVVERFKIKHPSSCLDLKYEDLVSHPDDEIDGVASFLSLDALTGERAGVSFGDEALPHYQKAFKAVDTQSVEKWKHLLSKSDVRKIESICGQKMVEFGYRPDDE